MPLYTLATVKNHRANVAKKREVSAHEATLAEHKARFVTLCSDREGEISRLQLLVLTAQVQLDNRTCEVVGKRDEELRLAVIKREVEVATAMARREEAMTTAQQREQERCVKRRTYPDGVVEWVTGREAG